MPLDVFKIAWSDAQAALDGLPDGAGAMGLIAVAAAVVIALVLQRALSSHWQR